MERKLWGLFSGAQLTAIIGFITLAVAVPSGVWAVASYTNVALLNPQNGKYAYIDASRRLSVTDAYVEQSKVPVNFVRMFVVPNGSGCTPVYTVPTGKAFIIQATSSFFEQQHRYSRT